MLADPRLTIIGDNEYRNPTWNEDRFEESLFDLRVAAASGDWDHIDLWIDGISSVTRDDDIRTALKIWCDENLPRTKEFRE